MAASQAREAFSIIDGAKYALEQVQYLSSIDEDRPLGIETDEVQKFLFYWDQVFLYGLKSVKKGYWGFVASFSHSSLIDEVIEMPGAVNDLIRSRVWLGTILNENELENYLTLVQYEQKLLSKYYKPHAIVRNKGFLDDLISISRGQETTLFSIHLDYICFRSNQLFVGPNEKSSFSKLFDIKFNWDESIRARSASSISLHSTTSFFSNYGRSPISSFKREARRHSGALLGDEARRGSGTLLGDEARRGSGTLLGDEVLFNTPPSSDRLGVVFSPGLIQAASSPVIAPGSHPVMAPGSHPVMGVISEGQDCEVGVLVQDNSLGSSYHTAPVQVIRSSPSPEQRSGLAGQTQGTVQSLQTQPDNSPGNTPPRSTPDNILSMSPVQTQLASSPKITLSSASPAASPAPSPAVSPNISTASSPVQSPRITSTVMGDKPAITQPSPVVSRASPTNSDQASPTSSDQPTKYDQAPPTHSDQPANSDKAPSTNSDQAPSISSDQASLTNNDQPINHGQASPINIDQLTNSDQASPVLQELQVSFCPGMELHLTPEAQRKLDEYLESVNQDGDVDDGDHDTNPFNEVQSEADHSQPDPSPLDIERDRPPETHIPPGENEEKEEDLYSITSQGEEGAGAVGGVSERTSLSSKESDPYKYEVEEVVVDGNVDTEFDTDPPPSPDVSGYPTPATPPTEGPGNPFEDEEEPTDVKPRERAASDFELAITAPVAPDPVEVPDFTFGTMDRDLGIVVPPQNQKISWAMELFDEDEDISLLYRIWHKDEAGNIDIGYFLLSSKRIYLLDSELLVTARVGLGAVSYGRGMSWQTITLFVTQEDGTTDQVDVITGCEAISRGIMERLTFNEDYPVNWAISESNSQMRLKYHVNGFLHERGHFDLDSMNEMHYSVVSWMSLTAPPSSALQVPISEGRLSLKEPTYLSYVWKEYYFILDKEGKLSQFDVECAGSIKKQYTVIGSSGCRRMNKKETKKSFAFKFTSDEGTEVMLNCDNALERDRWMSAISKTAMEIPTQPNDTGYGMQCSVVVNKKHVVIVREGIKKAHTLDSALVQDITNIRWNKENEMCVIVINKKEWLLLFRDNYEKYKFLEAIWDNWIEIFCCESLELLFTPFDNLSIARPKEILENYKNYLSGIISDKDNEFECI